MTPAWRFKVRKRDYENISGDIVWSGEEDIIKPDDGNHLKEDEDMIDRVVVSHNGLTQWYCQVVANGTDSDTDQSVVAPGPSLDRDNIMTRKEDPSQHELTRLMGPA